MKPSKCFKEGLPKKEKGKSKSKKENPGKGRRENPGKGKREKPGKREGEKMGWFNWDLNFQINRIQRECRDWRTRLVIRQKRRTHQTDLYFYNLRSPFEILYPKCPYTSTGKTARKL